MKSEKGKRTVFLSCFFLFYLFIFLLIGYTVGKETAGIATMVTEKRVLNWREAEAEFDGRWFLLDKRDFPPEDDTGYVVAYGDGSAEDRESLREIQSNKYHGEVILMKGWVPKDDIFDSGIIEAV